ncbi:hypothetical protein BJX62DRAFT_228004 [Aspergillus germanicus]
MALGKIIVVGAGPSGLLLALLLAQKNIPVTVIEARDGLDNQPRATHYAAPAVKELIRAGLMEDILAQGVLPSAIAWRHGDGTPIATLKIAEPERTSKRLICLPLNRLCSVLWSTKVTAIGQSQDRAWVIAQTAAGTHEYGASYIIGCDGASSQIRRSLFENAEFPGRSWDRQIVATNVFYDFERFGWDDVNYILDIDHWYMAAKISTNGMWRVAYGEPMGFSKEELASRQPLKFELMLPGNPKPNQYRVTNFSPYKVHQRCVAKMRMGRFLVAADAAHLCNPFGGMGLTGGLVDVGNLYDCLAGMSDGLVDESILDKYDEVRRAKFRTIIDPLTTANFQRMFQGLQSDEFLKLVSKAETDEGLSRQLQANVNDLQHDFTQYFIPKP